MVSIIVTLISFTELRFWIQFTKTGLIRERAGGWASQFKEDRLGFATTWIMDYEQNKGGRWVAMPLARK